MSLLSFFPFPVGGLTSDSIGLWKHQFGLLCYRKRRQKEIKRHLYSFQTLSSASNDTSVCRWKSCFDIPTARDTAESIFAELWQLCYFNTQHPKEEYFRTCEKRVEEVSRGNQTPQMFILSTIFCNQIYFGDGNRVYRYVHVFYAHSVTLVVHFKLETTEPCFGMTILYKNFRVTQRSIYL